jgi:hypothetical protein
LLLASIKEAHEIFVEERHRGSMLSGVGRCACCSDRLYAKTRSYKLADGRKHGGHYLCVTHHESRQKDPTNRKCGNGWVTKTTLDSLAKAFIERRSPAPTGEGARDPERTLRPGRPLSARPTERPVVQLGGARILEREAITVLAGSDR